MTSPDPSEAAVTEGPLPCGYVFATTGGTCLQGPDHGSHRAGWHGATNAIQVHDYRPVERRVGPSDRRPPSQPSAPERPDLTAAYRAAREELCAKLVDEPRFYPTTVLAEFESVLLRHLRAEQVEPEWFDPTPEGLAEMRAVRDREGRPEQVERPSLDVERLAEALRAVLDTTTRRRVLPYADKIAAEYATDRRTRE